MDLQYVLFQKGAATALAFKPSYWSYDANPESGTSRPGPLPVPAATAEATCVVSSTLPRGETDDALEPTPVEADARTAKDRVAQQALAAGLAEIIESVLRTRQFATRAVDKSRHWSCETRLNPTPPVERPETDEATPGALRAEFARVNSDPAPQAQSAKPWIDRMLGCVGLAMVVPGMFFAVSLWQANVAKVAQAMPVAASASPPSVRDPLGIASETEKSSSATSEGANGISAGAVNSGPARK